MIMSFKIKVLNPNFWSIKNSTTFTIKKIDQSNLFGILLTTLHYDEYLSKSVYIQYEIL